MKKIFLLTLSALLISVAGFSQSAAIRAKNAALRSAVNSGQPASVQNTITYIDEVRSELGKWNHATSENDTVTMITFPGSLKMAARQTLYEVDVYLHMDATNDTVTGMVKISIDSTDISIALSAVLNPLIKIHGYIYYNSEDYFYELIGTVTNTTTNATTTLPLKGTFTRSTGNAITMKYKPVNLSEVDEASILTKVSLVKQ